MFVIVFVPQSPTVSWSHLYWSLISFSKKKNI
jgi:uncharacterized membrane protein YpjA